jgi:hypothetical protein
MSAVPVAIVHILCLLAGAAIIAVALHKIVVTKTNTNSDYFLCVLGAALIVFPVTGTLQLASAAQETRDQLGNLIQATQPHLTETAPPEPPPLPTPTPPPGPTSSNNHLKSAVEAAEKARDVYDEVRQPVPVQVFKRLFK